MVAGLAVRYLGSMVGDDSGAMVGIFVASIGLIFFFPALQTYLLTFGVSDAPPKLTRAQMLER